MSIAFGIHLYRQMSSGSEGITFTNFSYSAPMEVLNPRECTGDNYSPPMYVINLRECTGNNYSTPTDVINLRKCTGNIYSTPTDVINLRECTGNNGIKDISYELCIQVFDTQQFAI